MDTRYPVYVVSKGRHDYKSGLTGRFLLKEKVPFRLVVEPQEHDQYAETFGAEHVLSLPFSNLGLGSIPARNWIWEHSLASGAKRHWILDDNMRGVQRVHKGIRIDCDSGPAFCAIEDFVDRYENIGLAGMAYAMFGFSTDERGLPPFWLNVHVYSCLLIENSLPYRWRGRYNEDTDLSLQVLSGGLCTVLFNAFLVKKMQTMTMQGGNMDTLYKGDGRLRMSRSLERVWPYVVETKRRFKRPQHVVRDQWGKFDTPLKRRSDIDWSALKPNEYGLELRQLAPVKNKEVRSLLEK